MKITQEKLPVRQSPATSRAAFTLIELLTVIAVMAVLASFGLVVVNQIKKHEYIATAQAELGQIATALEDYQHQYGVYPPSNTANPLTNTLYYELTGVTNSGVVNGNGTSGNYQTLDNASSVLVTTYNTTFGVGALNCIKPGNDTESAKARSFLKDLKPNRIGDVYGIKVLITSMRGPDTGYKPMGPVPPAGQPQVVDVNPFRYVYPGTNNPNSYDLWVELVFGGKTNLVCNWTKQVIINSPLP